MNFETAEVTYEKPHRLSGILLHPTSCPSPYGKMCIRDSAYTVHAEKETTQGTTYYVSSSKGDDSNDGTSESKPFKTLEKINKLTLKPGDQVLLEKGSVFNDQYLHLKRCV